MTTTTTSVLFKHLALGLSAILMISCATTSGSKYSVSKAAPPASVTFAVKAWEAEDYASMNSNDKGVRDFEKIYLPLKLVEQLQQTSGVKQADITMAASPSTDFVVDGTIVESNGLELKLKLIVTRVDGAQIFSKTYSIEHKDARKPQVQATMNALFRSMATDLRAAAFKTNVNLPEARAKAYASNNNLNTTPKVVLDAQEAGNIERSAILRPITKPMLRRIPAMTPSYVEWQSISAPLVRDRNQAKSAKGWANLSQGLSLATGAMSVGTSYQAAQSGNTQLMQQSQSLMNSATMQMASAGAAAQVADNRINQISKTLNAYKTQFAIGSQRTITVRVFGKLVTLTGDQSAILKQFHDGVRQDLNSRSATPPAT